MYQAVLSKNLKLFTYRNTGAVTPTNDSESDETPVYASYRVPQYTIQKISQFISNITVISAHHVIPSYKNIYQHLPSLATTVTRGKTKDKGVM